MIKIAELKPTASLLDVVSKRVYLRSTGGKDWWGYCPFHAERTESFHVCPGARSWKCFGCGVGGDVIDFVCLFDRVGFIEAVRRITNETGMAYTERPWKRSSKSNIDRNEYAKKNLSARKAGYDLWHRSYETSGTYAETYWRSRNLSLPIPKDIRFHPALDYYQDGRLLGAYPALLAPVREPSGAFVALHRTYLSLDGRDKAQVRNPRKMLGSAGSGAIWLTRPAPLLVIGEGIETTWSVVPTLIGHGLPIGGVSAYSLAHIANLTLPVETKEVVILGDSDGCSSSYIEKILTKACNRFTSYGCNAWIWWAPPGCDFNDLICLSIKN